MNFGECMSSCQAVTLLSQILPHKNHISKQHRGQMPVQIQTLASLQQYRGSWQFLLDDKKSLIEKQWFIKQPIKYGGQALSGCMYVCYVHAFPKISTHHIDQLIIFQSSPPPKKRHENLAKKRPWVFLEGAQKTSKKTMPPKKGP